LRTDETKVLVGTTVPPYVFGRDARYWSPADQLAVASRAVAHIGFGSWPNTAAMCGLL